MKRRFLVAGAAGLIAAPGLARAQSSNGVALVIGNSKYKWEAPLPNVGRDAPDIARAFQAMGLKTDLLQDVGKDAMRAALERFKSAAKGANLAAFYFAGHGVFWERQTYIVPVDADLNEPRSVAGLIGVPDVNAATQAAGNRLLVFDSCRNSPADGWRQNQARSLARMDLETMTAVEGESNTLTLFSTPPGNVALDGPAGSNSPFAAAFLRQLEGTSVDLHALPARLRRDLLIATGCRQLMWDRNTYATPLVVKGIGKPAASRGTGSDSTLVELPKAYSFAQENRLLLPAGLVACRPHAAAAPEARMVGSFRLEVKANISGRDFSSFRTPALAIVFSVEDGEFVRLLMAHMDWRFGTGGARWWFMIPRKIENGFFYTGVEQSGRYEFTWRDRDSGTYSQKGESYNGSLAVVSAVRFNRLDG